MAPFTFPQVIVALLFCITESMEESPKVIIEIRHVKVTDGLPPLESHLDRLSLDMMQKGLAVSAAQAAVNAEEEKCGVDSEYSSVVTARRNLERAVEAHGRAKQELWESVDRYQALKMSRGISP